MAKVQATTLRTPSDVMTATVLTNPQGRVHAPLAE